MVLLALVIWCSLCRQTVADQLGTPNKPRGQEVPFQIGGALPSSVPTSLVPSHLSVPAAQSAPGLPISTSLPQVEKPSVQVPVNDRPLPHAPHGDSSSVSGMASVMDQPSRPLLMGYYPDWVGDEFPPEQIDFSRYDWLDFAFAVPDSKFRLVWDDDAAPNLLSRLVTAAHATTTKVKLSIGGWTGSKYFSPAVATEQNRRTFANNILAVYNTYDLDGIDLDWEYPGHEGNDGNLYDPSDTSNFLAFLKVLRATLPATAKISAAVQTIPFLGKDGDPITDTTEFGIVFDWILLMNYDTWESSSPPGPNAPLYDSCSNSSQPSSSASAGVLAWSKSGFPISKLVLGLPSYGYVSRSTSERLKTREDLSSRDRHHWHDHEDNEKHHIHEPIHVDDWRWRNHWGGDQDGNRDGGWGNSGGDDEDDGDDDEDDDDGGDDRPQRRPSPPDSDTPRPIVIDDSENQIQFRDLVEQGALRASPGASGAMQYVAGGGFERRWDSCSETPFLRSTGSRQIVTYDDGESLALKARFAKEVGMLGVNVFDVHGDTDDGYLLLSIQNALAGR